MSWTNPLDTNTPENSDRPKHGASDIRTAKRALIERLDKDHDFGLDDGQVSKEDAGEHKKVTLQAQESDPVTGEEKSSIFSKIVDGVVELFFKDGRASSAKTIRLTTNGAIALPVGTMQPYAGASVDDPWKICNGEVLSASEFPALYDIIGTTYGSAGAGTFKLPDARGRALIGAGQGPGLTNRNRGAEVGSETHQLSKAEMPKHDHGEAGEHNHQYYAMWQDTADNFRTSSTSWDADFRRRTKNSHNTANDGEHSHDEEGGDGAHNNMQPSLAVNYIIKVK